MCRNIRPLYNFEPPATEDEVRAAALQYVRKISGFSKPSQANEEAFERAIDAVADSSMRLLDELVTAAPPKDRETEAAKARARSAAALRRVGSRRGNNHGRGAVLGDNDPPSRLWSHAMSRVSCPQCARPAEITERFTLGSTGGPLDHVKTRCPAGHWFTVREDRVEAYQVPAPRDPAPHRSRGAGAGSAPRSALVALRRPEPPSRRRAAATAPPPGEAGTARREAGRPGAGRRGRRPTRAWPPG